MFNRLYEAFGAELWLYYTKMGVEAGRNRVEKARSVCELPTENLLDLISAEKAAEGWGIAEIVELD